MTSKRCLIFSIVGRKFHPHQAVGIQAVGRIVRGHHEHHAAIEERIEQTAEDHRVGDVRDVELVEAQQAGVGGDAIRHLLQRIGRVVELAQVVLHLLHEGVEVHPALAPIRHRVVEAIHQEALAPPHAAPEVNAARHLGLVQELLEPTPLARDLEADELGVQTLQALGGGALGGVGLVAARLQQGFVGVDHSVLGNVQDAMGHGESVGSVDRRTAG